METIIWPVLAMNYLPHSISYHHIIKTQPIVNDVLELSLYKSLYITAKKYPKGLKSPVTVPQTHSVQSKTGSCSFCQTVFSL